MKTKTLFTICFLFLGAVTVKAQQLKPFEDSNQKWGYKNASGNVVVKPKYTSVNNRFHEGMASVAIDGKIGFINDKGVEIVPPKYDGVDEFADGLALVNLGGKWPEDPNAPNVQGGKWGYIDKTGKEVIPLIYDEIRKFKNGKVVVSIGKYPNRKAGMIDNTGKEIVPLKYKTLWDDFSVGRALFQTVDDTFGFIDETGKEAIPPLTQYSTVNSFQAKVGLAKVFVGKSPNSKGGFIDKNGKEAVAPKYDQLGAYFSDGLLSVGIGAKAERKFGYIDPTGKEVIPLIYKRAEVFKSGRARVTDFNNRTFYIDKTGKEVE